ncbi:hypothetical protein EVAR_93505_1 [Eumeta japonica]|uniref:Uncharacterized protein n=1 Tax=Eumeta variegata TaxID=151549 RepID=A0A4C1TKQ5_EUMVA|nr:hypothetical protein EVAR_93505_1 [Eumeta japonica]
MCVGRSPAPTDTLRVPFAPSITKPSLAVDHFETARVAAPAHGPFLRKRCAAAANTVHGSHADFAYIGAATIQRKELVNELTLFGVVRRSDRYKLCLESGCARHAPRDATRRRTRSLPGLPSILA